MFVKLSRELKLIIPIDNEVFIAKEESYVLGGKKKDENRRPLPTLVEKLFISWSRELSNRKNNYTAPYRRAAKYEVRL